MTENLILIQTMKRIRRELFDTLAALSIETVIVELNVDEEGIPFVDYDHSVDLWDMPFVRHVPSNRWGGMTIEGAVMTLSNDILDYLDPDDPEVHTQRPHWKFVFDVTGRTIDCESKERRVRIAEDTDWVSLRNVPAYLGLPTAGR
jgi:hypothetical protein